MKRNKKAMTTRIDPGEHVNMYVYTYMHIYIRTYVVLTGNLKSTFRKKTGSTVSSFFLHMYTHILKLSKLRIR